MLLREIFQKQPQTVLSVDSSDLFKSILVRYFYELDDTRTKIILLMSNGPNQIYCLRNRTINEQPPMTTEHDCYILFQLYEC